MHSNSEPCRYVAWHEANIPHPFFIACFFFYFYETVKRNSAISQPSRVGRTKIPRSVTGARLPDSCPSVPYRAAQMQRCTVGGPIPEWCMGPVRAPEDSLRKKLLQVLAVATSGVDMSQHQTTSDFFSVLCTRGWFPDVAFEPREIIYYLQDSRQL